MLHTSSASWISLANTTHNCQQPKPVYKGRTFSVVYIAISHEYHRQTQPITMSNQSQYISCLYSIVYTCIWRVHPFSSPPFRRRHFVAAISLCHFVAAVSSPDISSWGHLVASHFVVRTLRRLAFRRRDTSSQRHFVASRFIAGTLCKRFRLGTGRMSQINCS